MNIYFSGIGGVGIGPLAEIAHDAGHSVAGSDANEGLITQQLRGRGINLSIGQDGSFLAAEHARQPIDRLVYTAALPTDHPELLVAKELGIHTAKRDEFLAEFIKEHSLQLIAIAGTHGKTSTTGMAVWAFKQLGIPVSYSVGSTLTFGPSGAYDPDSKYFIYECDEFDRNFLHFSPDISLITAVDYDHPDTYPTEDDYKQAFTQYLTQSKRTILWDHDQSYIGAPNSETQHTLTQTDVLKKDRLALAGEHTRRNATLVYTLLMELSLCTPEQAVSILNTFPGTDRRFERIAQHLYSDYGHHPKEIAATLQLAREIAPHITLVYQPHQNVRQHEVIDDYTDAVFKDADEIYWLPTYLTRERADLPVLTSAELTRQLTRKEVLHMAELDENLGREIANAINQGSLVLCMGAGSIDSWIRDYAATTIN